MNTKIFAIAAAALAITAGAASANPNTDRQAHAGGFDQGGVFSQEVKAEGRAVDHQVTASTGNGEKAQQAGVPSDFRNEGGLGLFDRLPQ